MDEIFPLLLFLIFVLGPIIEGLKRKNKDQQPPRPPQQRLPQQRQPPERSRVEEISTRKPADESAAGMVPDDLWEMLTGQKRVPAPARPPERWEPDDHVDSWEEGYEDEEDAADEEQEYEREADAIYRRAQAEDAALQARRMRTEAVSLETLERHEQPVVISLEDDVVNARRRHAVFHEKIARPVPVVERKHHVRFALGLHDPDGLRKAMLLRTIIGPPKALE